MEDITFIYIETPHEEPSQETTLLRELSKETFSRDHPLKTIFSEKPAAITVKEILQISDTPIIALSLDDTTYYSKSWLSPLREALEKGFELVSPVCHGVFNIDMPYYTPLTFNDVAEQMLQNYRGQYVQTPHIPPLAFLLSRKSLIESSPEMSLFELPVKLKSALVPSSLIHRFGDYYSFTREDLLPYVPQGVQKVLDVGCAKGLLGETIKRERGCRVYGVEMNMKAAEEAKGRLDDVFCVDIENAQLPFHEDLDLILFADILEHLFNPWRVVENARKWLKPKGIVIASIPNIAHYSIILDLLRGRWDYVPFGLLCVSHIRFFTKTSIERMFIDAGYSLRSITPQASPLLKKQFMRGLGELIKFMHMGEDIFHPGYYVVAKKT